ncbi:hypothetical protein JCM11251_005435 [Rhodosporidiobolus azoricus]
MTSRVEPAEGLIGAQPVLHSSAEYRTGTDSVSASSSSPDLYDNKLSSEGTKSETSSLYDVAAAPPLAPREEVAPSAGLALLQLFGLRKKSKPYDLDAVATEESVFDGPLGKHYVPFDRWENKGYFDPSFRWTRREERAVTRKIDFKLFAWILVMFLALDIDRGNLANGTADNLLNDLKLTQADYNLGNTLSKLGFLTAELPSQMVGKKLGVDIWLPMQLCIFSVLAFAQFWMNGRASFLALRFLIAFFQGGFIPDVILYLSYYYTKHNLPIRLAFFWSINYIADMITAFLAVGLLKMRGIRGYAGWRWMFLVEGLFTLTIGIASFFMLPPGPSQTKAPWRPKGYFTDKEVKIIVNRVVRDDPHKATMHNRQALTPKLLWKSLCDYDLWPMYAIALTFGIPGVPIKAYFQLSMKGLGFSTVMANVLSVPNTAISVVNLLLITLLSETVNSRTWVASIENWWFLIFFIPLRVLPSPINPWTYFALATLVLGFPYAHALQVAWCSRNAGSVRTRTVSASVYNMFVQVSSIIGSNLYQASDAPRYFRANSVILGIIAMNLLIIYPGTYTYYRWRNAQKEKAWSKMTTQERSQYLATTTDEGAKRLDFRFAY